jgi:hypothetical protein
MDWWYKMERKETLEQKYSENGKLAFPVCSDCGERHYRRAGTPCVNKPLKITFFDLLNNSSEFSGEVITKGCGGQND